MSEKNLQELLTLMRRMYAAAQNGRWDAVNELDQLRNSIFDNLSTIPTIPDSITKAAVSEIIELDHAVLSLANHGMEKIAAQTRSL